MIATLPSMVPMPQPPRIAKPAPASPPVSLVSYSSGLSNAAKLSASLAVPITPAHGVVRNAEPNVFGNTGVTADLSPATPPAAPSATNIDCSPRAANPAADSRLIQQASHIETDYA